MHCAGLDELGLHAPTLGHEVRDDDVEAFRLDPRDLGIEGAAPEALRVENATESADRIRSVLAGER